MSTAAPTFANLDAGQAAVVNTMVGQVIAGLDKIEAGNDILLADESGTSVREIDKELKTDENLPKEVKDLWKKAVDAQDKYKKAVEAARNAYRTTVLGEEEKAEAEVDKDELQEVRKLVMNAVSFVKTFAEGNNLKDVLEWVNTLAIPQVGRQGTSTVGQKKPRVFVKVGETVYDSFSLAAAAISDKDNKITAGDLADAWNAAGGTEGSFTFGERTVTVTYKQKKSEAA